MTERTILITEDLNPEWVESEIQARSSSLAAVLIRNRFLPDWQRVGRAYEVVTEADLWSVEASATTTGLHRRFPEVYDAVVNDARTLFIAERHWHSSVMRVEGSFKNAARTSLLCWNVLSLVDRLQPSRLVCASTPHVAADWVLARTAAYLGIPVYVVGVSPLPWRAWCLEGVDEQVPVMAAADGHDQNDSSEPSAEVVKFVELNAGQDYISAVPTIDRGVQQHVGADAGQRDLVAHKAALEEDRRRPSVLQPKRFLISELNRRRREGDQRELARRYNQLAEPLPQDGLVVSMFLHYQPERTTMPEGRGFANQVAAVHVLAGALPDGWRLAVREHPAIFHGPGPFYRAFRDPHFYDTIAALDRVSLVSLAMDAFEVVDRSDLVATITGTVGLQALCRGTPVLVFGATAYRGAPGVFEVPTDPESQHQALRHVFETVERKAYDLDRDALLRYLVAVEASSVGEYGATDEGPGSGVFVPTLRARAQAAQRMIP